MKLFGKNVLKILILFILGGLIYYGIEILWRGYSHLAMIVVGGISFVLIGYINEYLSWSTPLWKQCGIATIIVLIVEFISGCILNILMGLNIWDYSEVPFNILGQICLGYSVLWYFLSTIAIYVDDYFRWKLFGEKREKYIIF